MHRCLRSTALGGLFLMAACDQRGATSTPEAGGAESGEHGHEAGHGDGHGHGHGHGHADGHDGGHEHGHQGGHHRFENADEWAAVFESPERDAWQKPDDVVAWLGLTDGDDVAVLGAGTGYFAVRFARAIGQGTVYANDVEPDMVRYLGERATREGLTNLTAIQGRADDPALPNAVNVVFLCDVYHHIEAPAAFFEKVAAKMKPGARLVIVDFDPEAPSEDVPGPPPQMRVSASSIVDTLGPLGFSQVRLERDLLEYQYILELKRSE